MRMIFVYILAKIEAGTEDKILELLKNTRQIGKASLTFGVYDLCVEAQFKTMEELDRFVINTLRKVPGVKETVTLITSRAIFAQQSPAVSFG
jgi:DNA-binding Lrp family transcriptional regulator